MIAEGRRAVLLLKNLWIPAIPGALVSFTILGFYLIGDSLGKWQQRTQIDESFADAIHHQPKVITLLDSDPFSEPTLLDVRYLSVHNVDNQILNEVCFQIEQGKSLALIGESGAGKSTIALAIMGLLTGAQWKIRGAIRLKNVELVGKSQEEMSKIRGSQISMVFQEPSRALNPSLTILAHFSEVLQKRIKVASKEKLLQKASGVLKSVGLINADKTLNRYPHELSNGEQQRVMIGLALEDSELFIADEPTSALDAINQSLIIRLLRQLKESGNIKSILLITHNIRVAQEMGIDEIIILKDGELVKYGPTHNILNSEEEYTKKLIAATKRSPLLSRKFTEDAELILEVKNLTQYYKRKEFLKFSKFCAVRNVSFTLRVGECLGIVGESNCGKTTIAKVIIRILDNTEGEIIFHKGTRRVDLVQLKPDGTKHDDAKMKIIRQDIQMIFQNPDVTFNPYMTVKEVLTETINIYYDTKRVTDVIERLLLRVKLPSERLDSYVEELSGGEKQKLAIARALVPRPKLIIADEPFSRLDVILRQEILSILRGLLDQQVILACLVISHDLDFIAQLCDTIAIMYAGNIVEIGNKEEILSSPIKHPYTDKLLRCAEVFDSNTFTASEEFDDSDVSDSDAACLFYPQCHIAGGELCLKEEPKLKRVSDRDHFIACHSLT